MGSRFYAIIAGVGPGTGRAAALKFAQTYPVVLFSRSSENYDPIVDEIKASGGSAVGLSVDVSSPESVSAAFESIKETHGEAKLAAAIFNVGGRFVRKPFLDLSLEDYEAGYAANGRGLFLFAQKTIPLLLSSVDSSPHPPSLIVTGATASVKGSAQCASFASGNFAKRATTQSLAREFGPQGVHVAHAIIDGVIDMPRTRSYHVNGGVEDGKLNAAAIADAYWWLHTQPRSTFAFEIDLRPYAEKW